MQQTKSSNGALLVAAILLLVAFFIPWLNWDGTKVSGWHFPSGQFFAFSEEKFGLANPFPEYSFLNYAFWVIPAGALLIILLASLKKKAGLVAILTSITALSLVTVYILFTQTIIEQVGTVKSLFPALQLGLYATIIAAVAIILASMPQRFVAKTVLIIIGPLLTWAGFAFMSSKVMKDHGSSTDLKADYTITSEALLREFAENDSLANAKYKEKLLTVNGKVSETEQLNDSTVNIKFVDSTGSYAQFSFVNPEAQEAKKIKQGDDVSLKGSCSGGEYSDILGVHFITFKRSVINK